MVVSAEVAGVLIELDTLRGVLEQIRSAFGEWQDVVRVIRETNAHADARERGIRELRVEIGHIEEYARRVDALQTRILGQLEGRLLQTDRVELSLAARTAGEVLAAMREQILNHQHLLNQLDSTSEGWGERT